MQTFDVVIDSVPLVAVFDTRGVANGSQNGGTIDVRAGGDWELELVPDLSFPCDIESYGYPCGALLTATTDFDHPGLVVITLWDPSLPPLVALGLGYERRSIPQYGCTLYHELLVLYPWSIDANGRAVVVFDPPRIPGCTFKVRAATLQGATLHATNGLDFLMCRSGN